MIATMWPSITVELSLRSSALCQLYIQTFFGKKTREEMSIDMRAFLITVFFGLACAEVRIIFLNVVNGIFNYVVPLLRRN